MTNDERLIAARVKVREGSGFTKIRLRGFSPFMVFIAVLVVAIVVEGFAYPMAAMIFHPNPIPDWLAVFAITTALAIALVLAYRRHVKISSGHSDLVIDDTRKTISLPWNFGRTHELTIAIDQITEITTASENNKNEDLLDAHTFGPKTYIKQNISIDDYIPDTGHRSEMVYAIVICWRDSNGSEILSPIVRWSGQQRTRAFAFWLCDRLGVAPDKITSA